MLRERKREREERGKIAEIERGGGGEKVLKTLFTCPYFMAPLSKYLKKRPEISEECRGRVKADLMKGKEEALDTRWMSDHPVICHLRP